MATIRVKRSTGTFAPTGLTFGEPAYVGGITSFYVTNNDGISVRVGAEVSGVTFLGTSDNILPTQNAIKSYVDAAMAGVGGVVFSTIAVGNQSSIIADTTGDTLNIAAGPGITLATNAETDTLTIGNTGVTSLTGTLNEIEVNVNTGAVTVGLPNDVTVTNNLTVGGNLTVSGTTTTVHSDVTTIDDPMILLGTSGGVPITVTDGGKDRGVAYTYFDSAGKTGFFGLDASASKFTFIPDAVIASDIVTSGSVGDAQFKSLYLTLDGTSLGGLTLATLSTSRTYTLPDVSGTIITTGDSGTVTSTMIANGTIVNDDINSSAAIADSKLATISTADKVSLTALNIDGGEDIDANIVDADLIIVDDGGAGTNRKSAVSRMADYVFTKISGDITIAAGGAATIAANSIELGTDTTGNYVATVATSSTGLSIGSSGTENAAVTVNFSNITSGLAMGTFTFSTGEFVNSSGTISLGTVDGGSF